MEGESMMPRVLGVPWPQLPNPIREPVAYVLCDAYHELSTKGIDELHMMMQTCVACKDHATALIIALVIEMDEHRRRYARGYGKSANSFEWVLARVLAWAEATGDRTRDYGPPAAATAPMEKPSFKVTQKDIDSALPPPVVNEAMLKSLNDKYKENRS